MSIFQTLVHIRENATYYSNGWTRKEHVSNWLLNTLFKERYALYVRCKRLSYEVEDLKRDKALYGKKIDKLIMLYADQTQ